MVAVATSAGGSNERIPGYQLLGELGKGAITKVFKARQISLDRIVAIRVYPKAAGQVGNFSERFFSGGKAAIRVHHDNVVQTIDAGQTPDGFLYLVMEYIDGTTLSDLMAPSRQGEAKSFTESEVLEIFIPISDALVHVHQSGLLHCDLKPKNILLTAKGIPKLSNLPFARLLDGRESAVADAGKAFGTPFYISPEQIRGDAEIDTRADIYSLGATMYHLITGRPVFQGETPSSVMHQHLRDRPIPANDVNEALSSEISRIIDVAMAKRKEDRYQTMEMMLQDLRACRGKA